MVGKRILVRDNFVLRYIVSLTHILVLKSGQVKTIKKGSADFYTSFSSRKRDSNPRLTHYEWVTLPTELFRQFLWVVLFSKTMQIYGFLWIHKTKVQWKRIQFAKTRILERKLLATTSSCKRKRTRCHSCFRLYSQNIWNGYGGWNVTLQIYARYHKYWTLRKNNRVSIKLLLHGFKSLVSFFYSKNCHSLLCRYFVFGTSYHHSTQNSTSQLFLNDFLIW